MNENDENHYEQMKFNSIIGKLHYSNIFIPLLVPDIGNSTASNYKPIYLSQLANGLYKCLTWL